MCSEQSKDTYPSLPNISSENKSHPSQSSLSYKILALSRRVVVPYCLNYQTLLTQPLETRSQTAPFMPQTSTFNVLSFTTLFTLCS
ncbi:hypothetical protein JTE90_013254 [Oedothorax gibbosus]|uniref:Uncharacterized protein n=1 Tax=Oedothorax gibbosus TaxID=931172 RepID=A0AAV6VFR5_9ARAC|nr:hypothetical protein JTE90_013254 [Oedothorax gibbosus]